MNKILSLAGISILLISGCATQPTSEQLAQGTTIKGFYSNIPYDQSRTRATNIAHLFGIPIDDIDPEKKIVSKTENAVLGNVVYGVAENGWLGGVVGAGKALTKGAVMTYRGEIDEWNALIAPTGYMNIYAAQIDALNQATDLTIKGLEQLGYKTAVSTMHTDKQTGEPVEFMKTKIHLINEKRGCLKPSSNSDEGCAIHLTLQRQGFASREATPEWLYPSKDTFVIRSIVIHTKGETTNGKEFALTREEREQIAKASQKNFFYFGAYDHDHAPFIGENGTVTYCHMLPDRLQKSHDHDKKNLAERVSERYQRQWEDRGMLMFLDSFKP